jgi:hypothetical protein
MKRGVVLAKVEPWDSGWVELKTSTTWTVHGSSVFRVDRLEVTSGAVRKVLIGRLTLNPLKLPYPSVEPGQPMIVVGYKGTRFRMTGVQIA